MRRLVQILVLVVAALTAGSLLSSAATGASDGTAAAKKCKKTKNKKCKKPKKKPATVVLKDGDYTYKQSAAGSAPVNTLTISGKGTKVRIRELFFSSGESTAGLPCAATMVDFGTMALKRSGDLLTWSSAKPVVVPPIQTSGAGGGTGRTSGEINVKTLDVYVTTNVVMKNRNGAGGCLEGHTYEQPQKLKRK